MTSGNFSFVMFQVYVLKRPYVDEFLQKMGELFECVLFTASLAKVRPILKCKMFLKPIFHKLIELCQTERRIDVSSDRRSYCAVLADHHRHDAFAFYQYKVRNPQLRSYCLIMSVL